MTGELDERTLIFSAQRGDLDAFNRLIDRYQGLVFRIALRMLGDEDNAADASQMAWISAFRNLNGLRGDRLRTWLARVTVNTCYDEIRRGHRRREVQLLQMDKDGEEVEAARWLADPTPGVEEIVDAHEFEDTLHKCLLSLIPAYRTILILVDIEGLSYEEAASVAGVPIGTVRSRLARARLAMRQQLQQQADLLPPPQRFQISPTKRPRVRCP